MAENHGQQGKKGTVAVFGAGIAGLTAAHELAERGFEVTVYEPLADERKDDEKPEGLTVRLGGMAASQYLKGDRLRRFPEAPPGGKVPRPPTAGEHGFRFFPAYYLHLWDTLRRIPVYDDASAKDPEITARTVYDNVRRVITQAVASYDGQPALVFPREAPRSIAELYGALGQIRQFGFEPTDIPTFLGRIVRYLVTSPERRSRELEDVSAFDFLVGADGAADFERYRYSKAFKQQIREMPKILAAFDSVFGDARTNVDTYIQLNMALDRYDSKADGVLNGPTTLAWFDHWYLHLKKNLGVHFEHATLLPFRSDVDDEGQPVLRVAVAPGDQLEYEPHKEWPGNWEALDCDYYVVAADAFRAEFVTDMIRDVDRYREVVNHLRKLVKSRGQTRRKHALRTMSTIVGLDGWATSKPPGEWPPVPSARDEQRNPMLFEQLGIKPWDRFQPLSGIQFFFDTEFQILRGHIYLSDSKWALSAISQSDFWVDKPNLGRDGYVSVLSVDIGDWNKRSDDGKKARECSPDDLARQVWKQITAALVDNHEEDIVAKQLPSPIWYAIDEHIRFDDHGKEKPVHDGAPYLVPRIGDWKNRPGADPWNPQGTSMTVLPNGPMRKAQKQLDVWQARHGGYQLHFSKLVFAGTWCKTFTRMTTMEAACESGRHAVNAILDHYVHEHPSAPAKKDRRDLPGLRWNLPDTFMDQELSTPIREPTPAGDYCFIFDIENREPADARPTRLLDSAYFDSGLPHPWQVWGIDNASAVASSYGAGGPTIDLYQSTGWIVEQVRQWRKLVEAVTPRVDAEEAGPGAPAAAESDGPGWLQDVDLDERPPKVGRPDRSA